MRTKLERTICLVTCGRYDTPIEAFGVERVRKSIRSDPAVALLGLRVFGEGEVGDPLTIRRPDRSPPDPLNVESFSTGARDADKPRSVVVVAATRGERKKRPIR